MAALTMGLTALGVTMSISTMVTVSPTVSAPTPSPTSAPTEEISPTPDPTVAPTPIPTPTPLPSPGVTAVSAVAGTEPTVSVNRENGDIAVVTQNIPWPKLCSRPSVRISKDGGHTFGAAIYPLGNTCEDIHAVIAWGPNGRLWFGDGEAVGKSQIKMGVTYSDDYGKSWAKLYVQTFTPAWVGCFPMIAVNNEPGDPSYGTLYVAYNWLANS